MNEFILFQGSLPVLENPQSERLRTFVDYLQSQRTCHANIYVIRLVSLHGKQLLPLKCLYGL